MCVPVALGSAVSAGSSEPSAHDAMSITDATAASFSIVAGFAASTYTMASEPAERCTSSPPGASATDGGLSLWGDGGSVALLGTSASVMAGAAVVCGAVFVLRGRRVAVGSTVDEKPRAVRDMPTFKTVSLWPREAVGLFVGWPSVVGVTVSEATRACSDQDSPLVALRLRT